MTYSLFDLPWWGVLLATLALTHITIVSVTVFLHRHQAHRALSLHPAISHFFRFWLWLTTGMVTREWVAIHRKHHVKCDQAEDPHSPRIFGIRRVLWSGAELYRREADNEETIERHGQGTPDDWLERHLYAGHPAWGIALMLLADLALFGPIGLTVWAVQMLWIPLFAAGVVNGIGHYWGYRSYATADASRNILPWGLLIGGEELHNNHHACSSSARLSSRWWELDIGWAYIQLFRGLRLAEVHRVAPRLGFNPGKTRCDQETVQALVTHRFEVLAKFASAVKGAVKAEIRDLRRRAALGAEGRIALAAARHWLVRDAGDLPSRELAALDRALDSSPLLRTIQSLREGLTSLWNRSTESTEQLAAQMEDWCRAAEASGIGELREFSLRLRGYV
ncbi:MAG TPA: fatty acid desaturase [Rhodocyclaceae bacterium]